MLHGALNLDGTLSVVKVEKTLTGLKYIDVLKEHVLPQIRAKNQPGIFFQHDNAPCHQAKVVKEFMINEDLECLSWPPHSPDLSLIEHAWKMLKDLVYSALTVKNKESLWQAILSAVDIFNLTKANTINKMRQNLTDRYLNVLINKGEIFKS